MEVMVALAVSSMVLAGVMTFLDLAGKSLSGAATQTLINQRAGNSSEFIFSRVRFATSVTDSNDASGNTLRLGFDDNYTIDKNNDGKPYNDQDHYEVVQFQNGDGQDNTISDNCLIYKPREDQTNFTVLIPSGVQKLPGRKIFTVTNNCAVYVNYAVADALARDGYQTCDVQSTFVSRNRPLTTNTFTILP